MPTRRVVRKVDRGHHADFDEQLWPINCVLFILACCVAAAIITAGAHAGRFVNPLEDPRPLHNAWLHLGALGLVMAGLFLASVFLNKKRWLTRRMQLAVMLALLIHFWYGVGLYFLDDSLARNSKPCEWIAKKRDAVTVPDYGQQHRQQDIVERSLTRPTEVTTPDPEMETRPQRSPTTDHEVRERPSPREPARSVQRTPNQAQMQRAKSSTTRRAEERSGMKISRTVRADRVAPQQDVKLANPLNQPRRSPTLNARVSPLERRETESKQKKRQTDAPRTDVQRRQELANIQRAATARQAREKTSSEQLARSQSFNKPQIVKPEVRATQAKTANTRQPQASPRAMPVRSETPAASASRVAAQTPRNSTLSNIQRSDPRRAATPDRQPQLARADTGNPSRADTRLNAPSAQPQVNVTSPGSSSPRLANLNPSTNPQQRSQTNNASGGATPSAAPSTRSQDFRVASAQPVRIRRESAPTATNSNASQPSRSFTPLNAPTPDVGGQIQLPKVALNRAQRSGAGGPNASRTALPRSAASGSGAISRGAESGLDTPANVSGGIAAAAPSRASSSQTPSQGSSGGAGQPIQLTKSSSGIRLGGASPEAAPVSASRVAATNPGNGIEASSQGTSATRTQTDGGVVAARADNGSGAPSSASGGSNLPSASEITRASGGGGQQAGVALSGSPSVVGKAASGLRLDPSLADPVGAVEAGVKAGQATRDALAGNEPSTGMVRRQSTSGSVGEKTSTSAPVGGLSNTASQVAANSPQRASGNGAGPELGSPGARLARSSSGGSERPSVEIDVTPVEAAGGGSGQTKSDEPVAQVSGPRRRDGGAPSTVGNRTEFNVPGGRQGEAALAGGTPGPRRADSGQQDGPELASASGPQPLRRASSLDLPGGIDLADDPGPLPGAKGADGQDVGSHGPAVSRPTRSQSNDLPVRVAANVGPGGLNRERPGELGLPNQMARRQSDEVKTTVQRFDLQKSTGSLTLNVEVRPEPAPAFKERNPSNRTDVAKTKGGSAETEAAVEAGLDFLARHQMSDGRWSLHDFTRGKPYNITLHERRHRGDNMHSDTAATGLALLAFGGAGYTHQEGKYKDTVAAGLRYLLENQKSNGDLYNGEARYVWLYSHGIAAIALCEAYGMTRDPQLREPAQKALDFIVYAQHPQEGGWRYAPRVGSDTSVSGWQLMALKSGELAGLKVPEKTYDLVRKWLGGAKAGGDDPRYIYRPNAPSGHAHQRRPSKVMTAEALLMRLYLDGKPEDKDMIAGADYLQQNLPSYGAPERMLRDAYYWYYATQVMIHMQGEHWEAWNGALKKLLTEKQVKQGPFTGSWHPLAPIPDRWGHAAGRVYVTAMHVLMLEVYYRKLPLYTKKVTGGK